MDFFTMKDVEKKNGENDTIWIVIENNVYDVSSYMKRDLHPGGNEVLQKYAGQDATESFSALHSDDAWRELEQFRIGSIKHNFIQRIFSYLGY
tara:strand:+ start:846 stop:1124 length:279 start_codon:yes stop_codon:yes gene_type:complete